MVTTHTRFLNYIGQAEEFLKMTGDTIPNVFRVPVRLTLLTELEYSDAISSIERDYMDDMADDSVVVPLFGVFTLGGTMDGLMRMTEKTRFSSSLVLGEKNKLGSELYRFKRLRDALYTKIRVHGLTLEVSVDLVSLIDGSDSKLLINFIGEV